MHLDTPYKKFKKIIKRYNKTVTDEKDKLPDIPLHSLQHTSATLLINQNIAVKTVSNRFGHSQTSTTIDIYTHALKQLDKKLRRHWIICFTTSIGKIHPMGTN